MLFDIFTGKEIAMDSNDKKLLLRDFFDDFVEHLSADLKSIENTLVALFNEKQLQAFVFHNVINCIKKLNLEISWDIFVEVECEVLPSKGTTLVDIGIFYLPKNVDFYNYNSFPDLALAEIIELKRSGNLPSKQEDLFSYYTDRTGNTISNDFGRIIDFLNNDSYLPKYQYKYQDNNPNAKKPFPTKFLIYSGVFIDLSYIQGEEDKQDFIQNAADYFTKNLKDKIVIHKSIPLTIDQLDVVIIRKQ